MDANVYRLDVRQPRYWSVSSPVGEAIYLR